MTDENLEELLVFPLTIRLPPEPNSVFANVAADNMVGKVFRFADRPVRVTKAWVDGQEMLLTLEEA